jgi:DNA topoisomerase 2-associated protein PAT1
LIYDKVLSLEQMVRQRPQPLGDRESYELMERWSTDYTTLASSLWEELRVNEPIGLYHPHSFIQILSYAKGKKLIPRVFRHCSPEQTLSAVTLITASLDIVDVCRIGRSTPESLEQAELFLSNIMPVIVGCVADVPFRILLGLVSLMIGRCNILWLAHSKVGLSFLTMYLSRGEILSQPGHVVEVPDERDVRQWMELHDTIFNLLRGSFAQLFSSLEYSHDVVDQDAHIWQFLAAVAVGASPEQQHQLVSEVRDQVLQNIQRSTYGNLSPDKAALRIANVNLFLHALGLDASQVTMAL